MEKTNKFLNYLVGVLLVFSLPCLIIVFGMPFKHFINVNDTRNFLFLMTVYFVMFLILFMIGFINNKKIINKNLWLFIFIVLINIAFRVINAEVISADYYTFLSNWVDDYRNLSLKECFSSSISNYSPPYNYFLILISRIPFKDLYLIKTLSFIFELLSAYMITKLIAYINKKDFNIFIFASILFVPVFLINSSVWSQCDSIYTFFSFMAIYFAVKRNSKLSFVFFGLSLCFKFQSIILFPVALVLLLNRDKEGNKILKWKDLWLAPLTYIGVTGVSMVFGKSFNDAFLVYFEQSVAYDVLSGGCPNVGYLVNFLDDFPTIQNTIMIVLILLTLGVMSYILIKYIKKKKLSDVEIVNLAFLMTFYIVLLMPKMLDRYFYMCNLFAVVLMFTSKNKLYLKCVFVTLVSSCVAHFGTTPYYSFGNDYLLAYNALFALYVSAVCSSITGVMIPLVTKGDNL